MRSLSPFRHRPWLRVMFAVVHISSMKKGQALGIEITVEPALALPQFERSLNCLLEHGHLRYA